MNTLISAVPALSNKICSAGCPFTHSHLQEQWNLQQHAASGKVAAHPAALAELEHLLEQLGLGVNVQVLCDALLLLAQALLRLRHVLRARVVLRRAAKIFISFREYLDTFAMVLTFVQLLNTC